MFVPPFHDDSRASTFAALVARLESVIGEAGCVEVSAGATGSGILVWSRDERPVAFVSLLYDWIRLEFAGGYADVHGLADRPTDHVLDGVEAAIRERLVAVERLGPREPGDVSGDEPSRRVDRDAAQAGMHPARWSSDLLHRCLADQRFGPGSIDLPVVLPAVRTWLRQAAPNPPITNDQFTVELYDWPGDESTECAPPPRSLSVERPWVGLGFCRTLQRETEDGIEGVNGGVLQLWYSTDDDWRALFPELDLQPTSCVSFEAFGTGGSRAGWLLDHPLIERVLGVALTKRATLAYRWVGDDEDEFPAR